MRLQFILRLYVDTVLTKEQQYDVPQSDLRQILTELAEEHAALGVPFLAEFEFLGLPLENRFLRVGTDQRGMVAPREVDWYPFQRGKS